MSKSKLSGHTKLDRATLKKLFGDLPVVEGKRDLHIQLSPSDLRKAGKSPHNCVFAQACKRLWKSKGVMIYSTTAYIDLLDKNGDRKLTRFMISKPMAKVIQKFDNDGEVPEVGVVLRAPSPSQTVRWRVRHKRRWRADPTNAHIEAMNERARRKRRKAGKVPAVRHFKAAVFRGGTGKVRSTGLV